MKMKCAFGHLPTIVLACLAILAVPRAHAAVLYSITDLGTLAWDGTYGSAGTDVNDSGQVTGQSRTSSGSWDAVFWDTEASLTDMGTLPGGGFSYGYALNNLGQVTGMSHANNGARFAYLWDSSSGFTNLGALGGTYSVGEGINDNGRVTGYSAKGSAAHAFVWDSSSGMTDIGASEAADSYALDINNNDTVVGKFNDINGQQDIFIWDESAGFSSIGVSSTSVGALDINNNNQVAGSYDAADGRAHAFVWDETTGLTDLGTLGGSDGRALGINDSSQVVGYSLTSNGPYDYQPFLWDAVDGMINLNELVADATGWSSLTVASAISNSGFITGYGVTASGESHAFLLTPTETAWNGNTSSSGGGSTEGTGGGGSTGESPGQVPAPPTLILIGVSSFLLWRPLLRCTGVHHPKKVALRFRWSRSARPAASAPDDHHPCVNEDRRAP